MNSKAETMAHGLLTNLAKTDKGNWRDMLRAYPLNVLIEAADLCGVDSADMTKGQAIKAIVDNF